MLTADGKANDKFAHLGASWKRGIGTATCRPDRQREDHRYSEGCPRQIIEYGNLVYGFQCHMEFTPEVVDLLIAASETELATLTSHRFVQQPAALRAHDWQAMNGQLFIFLDRLMQAYAAP